MKSIEMIRHVAQTLGDAVSIDDKDGMTVRVNNPQALRGRIEPLVRAAALGTDPDRGAARWLIRILALESGAIPSSIHELYIARGRGKVRNDFTVPAMNLRALPFHAARAVFRSATAAQAGAFIFEIARSEMGYTDQRPSEYAACILGAAIAEGYTGPVFIQGDHFQASAKRYAEAPETELQAVRDLCREAILAGFYNIDIDTSTLVDLTQKTIPAQQRLNYTLCAEMTALIRRLEPKGVTVSVGGEIGEVGGHNSTEPELRAFMDGYDATLKKVARGAPGLSKISIQTGTSHGGVVLPDGSIARVKVDFDTLRRLSIVAQKEYGMGGAVQHGASTLPEEASHTSPRRGPAKSIWRPTSRTCSTIACQKSCGRRSTRSSTGIRPRSARKARPRSSSTTRFASRRWGPSRPRCGTCPLRPSNASSRPGSGSSDCCSNDSTSARPLSTR